MSTIISTGVLPNEHTEGSSNPRECHPYRHTIIFMDDDTIDSHISWELINSPKGIAINENGIIEGIMLPFDEQPLITDIPELEPLLLDGSNHANNGRYQGQTYTFEFMVKRTVMRIDASESETPMPPYLDTETSPVSITMIRDNDIDNRIFARNYLDVDEIIRTVIKTKIYDAVTMKIIIKNRHLNYDGIEYYKDDFEDFIEAHPGPFGNCLKLIGS